MCVTAAAAAHHSMQLLQLYGVAAIECIASMSPINFSSVGELSQKASSSRVFVASYRKFLACFAYPSFSGYSVVAYCLSNVTMGEASDAHRI